MKFEYAERCSVLALGYGVGHETAQKGDTTHGLRGKPGAGWYQEIS